MPDVPGTIAAFLAVSLFGIFVTAVVLIGRKAYDVLGTRASIEATKAKITKTKLEHELRILSHNQNLQALALTAGPQKEVEEPPEDAKGEVIEPAKTHDQYMRDAAIKKQSQFAKEAEVVDLGWD